MTLEVGVVETLVLVDEIHMVGSMTGAEEIGIAHQDVNLVHHKRE